VFVVVVVVVARLESCWQKLVCPTNI